MTTIESGGIATILLAQLGVALFAEGRRRQAVEKVPGVLDKKFGFAT